MADFNHVADEELRRVLGGDTSEDSIIYALNATIEANTIDQANPELPEEVRLARDGFAQAAHYAWNEQADAFATLEALRQFWRA